MICINCKKYNEEDAKFCIYCGTKFEEVNQQNNKVIIKKHNDKALMLPLIIVAVVLMITVGIGTIFHEPILGSIYFTMAKITEKADEDKAVLYVKKAIRFQPKKPYKEYVSGILVRQAEKVMDEDPKEAIAYIREAIDYNETDENKVLLSNAYLSRAQKVFSEDIDEAIEVALEGFEKNNSEELKTFLGESYLSKAEKQIESEPNDAIQTLSLAKEYVEQEFIIPLLNKAGEEIVRNENKGANVIKIILDDLNNDKTDEVIALINNDYDIVLKVYEYDESTYIETSSSYLTVNDYKDIINIETQKIIDSPSPQIVVSFSDKNQYGHYFTEVFKYKEEYLNCIFYSELKTEFGNENEKNKSIITKENLLDIEEHMLVTTYHWNGTSYVVYDEEITYTNDSFVYPSNPVDVAIAYLQAKAYGLDDELKQMTYTGSTEHLYFHEDVPLDNPFYGLDYIDGKKWGISIDYYEELFPTYDYYYDYYDYDYHINEYNSNIEKCFQINYFYDLNYDSVYLLLTKDGSYWKVWAAIE